MKRIMLSVSIDSAFRSSDLVCVVLHPTTPGSTDNGEPLQAYREPASYHSHAVHAVLGIQVTGGAIQASAKVRSGAIVGACLATATGDGRSDLTTISTVTSRAATVKESAPNTKQGPGKWRTLTQLSF